MKEEILRLLRSADGYISGQELCNRFGVSRTAVWKAINQLKEAGYEIEAQQNKGYRLMAAPDLMTEAEIKSLMHTDWVAKEVLYFDTIDSTNTKAQELAEKGYPSGTLVVADKQESGKGRRGRSWVSPSGTGIFMTLMIKPDINPNNASMLTLVAALAVAKAITSVTGEEALIKWPNDIVVNGKKVCGILTEAGTDLESGRLEWLVVGIGLNLTSTAADWPPELADKAGSLYPGGPAPVPRAALAGAIARELLALGPGEDCLDEYRARCFVPGHWVTVCTGSETYAAKALAIDAEGRLVVRRENGREEALRCGEVTTRPARTE